MGVMRHEYWKRAVDCLRRANETSSPQHRFTLLEMAQGWLLLLDQAEKNGQAVLESEMPLPRMIIPQPLQQPQQRAKDKS
jgi:hypothetical protein